MKAYEMYKKQYNQSTNENDKELIAEKFFNALDRIFLNSDMTQEEYNKLAKL